MQGGEILGTRFATAYSSIDYKKYSPTDGGIQSLDWIGGLDQWTGPVDWNGGLAEIVPKLVPRLSVRLNSRYLE